MMDILSTKEIIKYVTLGTVRAGQSRERSDVQVLRGKECRYSDPYF